ncbi:rCG59886 [Rattus norvegicus]|uniref:RCG59886 n=1 Tax=Rattus norvegicus TaxID=10116 RepID=A6HRF3_RAT|nr:rCG59886 [Rattus norvegicus]
MYKESPYPMRRIETPDRIKPTLRLIKQAFTDNYVLLLFILWGLCVIQNKYQMPICFIHFKEKKKLQVPLRIELLLIKHNPQ